jgi:hypothetical protein
MPKEFNVNSHNQKISWEKHDLLQYFRFQSLTRIYLSNRFQLFFTSISFILISYSLLLVAKKPATAYELSIYSSTPLIFWISVFVGLMNGLFLLLSSISAKSMKRFYIGMFQVIFCNILLVSIHALRNYMLIMGRGDNADYVGYAKDISIYGHVPAYNFYPYTSILISQISQILNIPVIDVSKYIQSLFIIIFMLSIYCWAKSFKNDQNFIVYSVIASIPLFFAWFTATIYYMFISTLILPLLFFVFNKNRDFRYRILVIIFCLVLPFAHPIVSLIFLVYLTCMFFESRLSSSKSYKVSLTLITIFVVSCSIWFLAQYSLTKCAIQILEQIKNALLMKSAEDTSLVSSMRYLDKLGFLTAMKSLLIMTFDEITYYIFSLLSVFFIFKNSKKDLLSVFLCFVLGSLFYVFLFISSSAHTPYRLINLNVNMIFAPLLLGYLMSCLRKQYRKILNIVIVFSIITTIASIYPSPITTYPNDQFTAQELFGAKWLLDSKNANISPITLMSPLNRYSSIIYCSNYTSDHKSSILQRYTTSMNSDSFRNATLRANVSQYFWITEYERQAYSTVWKDVGQFNENDFTSVNSYRNVFNIYDNQEVSIYLIEPSEGKI